ncbi:MAG: hypothetical protein F4213_18765 [Boseongicola sp. SB0677_bin_26]|nr:hypothetical protein [Boseongicola sp. SB0665_bin_10]MYG28033.1 hypothetical protein [Boseongicola sp. SB0677_bin_26]
MPHDPGTMASVLCAASALLALAAMARIACIDIRSLEIDPDWAAFAAWSGLAAIVFVEGPSAWPEAVAVAALAGGAAWGLARLRPGGIGQGDVALFALAGLVAGADLLAPVMGLLVAFGIVATVAYGLARGKGRRLFLHPVPAALPLMAALMPVFAWRVVSGLLPETVPSVAGGATVVALSGLALLSAGIVVGAFPMAVRRRAAARAAGPRGHDGRIHQPDDGKET